MSVKTKVAVPLGSGCPAPMRNCRSAMPSILIGAMAGDSDPASPSSSAGIDPVTVAVTFKVKPGHEAEFEAWAHDITTAAARYPGHLGASWVRSGGSYHVIYRFADHAQFKGWYDSGERAAFLKRLEPIATRVSDEHLTGMETWFQLPGRAGRPAPPRWKMVLATWIGVFPLL